LNKSFFLGALSAFAVNYRNKQKDIHHRDTEHAEIGVIFDKNYLLRELGVSAVSLLFLAAGTIGTFVTTGTRLARLARLRN
jgi:hypothetical protein